MHRTLTLFWLSCSGWAFLVVSIGFILYLHPCWSVERSPRTPLCLTRTYPGSAQDLSRICSGSNQNLYQSLSWRVSLSLHRRLRIIAAHIEANTLNILNSMPRLLSDLLLWETKGQSRDLITVIRSQIKKRWIFNFGLSHGLWDCCWCALSRWSLFRRSPNSRIWRLARRNLQEASFWMFLCDLDETFFVFSVRTSEETNQI